MGEPAFSNSPQGHRIPSQTLFGGEAWSVYSAVHLGRTEPRVQLGFCIRVSELRRSSGPEWAAKEQDLRILWRTLALPLMFELAGTGGPGGGNPVSSRGSRLGFYLG